MAPIVDRLAHWNIDCALRTPRAACICIFLTVKGNSYYWPDVCNLVEDCIGSDMQAHSPLPAVLARMKKRLAPNRLTFVSETTRSGLPLIERVDICEQLLSIQVARCGSCKSMNMLHLQCRLACFQYTVALLCLCASLHCSLTPVRACLHCSQLAV